MLRPISVVFSLLLASSLANAQNSANSQTLKLSLPSHRGQLQWRADGFQVIQTSAKPHGDEIGIRGTDHQGLTYLAFLFLVPGQTSLTSATCREDALDADRKSNPSTKISTSSEIARPDGPSIALASYTARDNTGKTWYSVRAFTAASDICGDFQFYTQSPISTGDPRVKNVLDTFKLDPSYVPQFRDVFLYAQVLYKAEQYRAAAPIFEQALTLLGDTKEDQTWRRVTTDQAGMSYGISGDINKARDLFNAAIAKDPDYPMYYYNLACADAEEHKLADARLHLQEAFARKANVIAGESMPDPTIDDSFTPYQNNKNFWAFLKTLK